MKKRSYSGRCKSRLSGSSFPSASVPIPPIASASSEVGRRSPSLQPSSRSSEGSGFVVKLRGVSLVDARGASSPPSSSRAGGVGGEGCGSWGRVWLGYSFPLRVGGRGVGGRLLSLLALRSRVLVRSAPPSVDSPASAECVTQSHSRGWGPLPLSLLPGLSVA